MKTLKPGLLLLVLSFMCNSCLEYTFTTRINADGSCERTMLIEGDSSEIDNGSIPRPMDDKWEWIFVKGIKDSINDSYIGTAKFSSVEEMNNYFGVRADSMPVVNLQSHFRKKFRWFYTYIVYTETYRKLLPLNRVPVSDFLSREEASIVMSSEDDLYYIPEEDLLRLKKDSTEHLVLSREDSLKMNARYKALEDKYKQWLVADIFEELYAIISAKAESGKETETLSVQLAESKSKIKTWWDSRNINLDVLEKDEILVPWADSIISELARHNALDAAAFETLRDTAAVNALEKRVDEAYGMTDDNYTNQVIMPGLIMTTNATSLQGNMVSWKVEPDVFFLYDYVMEVESRIINRWVFWLTGILIVLFAAGLLIGAWKKSSANPAR